MRINHFSLVELLLIFLIYGCQGTSNAESFVSENVNTTDTIRTSSKKEIIENDSNGRADIEPSQLFIEFRWSLDNNSSNTVPFSENNLGIYIDGFEVDANENFYFMAGVDQPKLVKFSGENRIWSASYDFGTSKVHLINDTTLLAFDSRRGENKLYRINSGNGDIYETSNRLINNIINDYFFVGSNLVLEPYNLTDSITLDTKSGYVSFDNQGQLIGQVRSIFDAPEFVLEKQSRLSTTLHISRWRGQYLLVETSFNDYEFSLINMEGKVIKSSSVSLDEIKSGLWGDEKEYVKLVGDHLYLLGRDKFAAVVTKLNLEKLFNKE